MSEHFNSKSMGLKAQKKLLGKMSSRTFIKAVIDDKTSQVLDDLYRVTKLYTGNKKQAEKLTKNIIKVMIKIGILIKNKQFNESELELLSKMRNKTKCLIMTLISFKDVEFTYDRNYLLTIISNLKGQSHRLIQRHLTEKSDGRILAIFSFYENDHFLDTIYGRTELSPKISHTVDKLMESLRHLLEDTK